MTTYIIDNILLLLHQLQDKIVCELPHTKNEWNVFQKVRIILEGGQRSGAIPPIILLQFYMQDLHKNIPLSATTKYLT